MSIIIGNHGTTPPQKKQPEFRLDELIIWRRFKILQTMASLIFAGDTKRGSGDMKRLAPGRAIRHLVWICKWMK